MHLLLINQYYPPDEAPTGLMLESVAEELVAMGHEVTVLCSCGGYAGATGVGSGDRESASALGVDGGVKLLRVGSTSFGRSSFLGKLIDYGSFYAGVGWELLTLRPKPNRVVALTTPPFLSLLTRIGSRLCGADHAHWVMDLYPDVMVAHGMLRRESLGHRILASLTRFGFGGKRCASVVTLGPDMAECVTTYLPAGRQADWVPLWSTEGEDRSFEELEEAGRALRRERGWADDETVVMYSGNMGLGHRFTEFLGAARSLSSGETESPKLRFVFYGGGKRKGEIEAFLALYPEARLELHGYVPGHQLAEHLRSADIHLASLEPSWDGTMVPSKLQGILGAGRPLIFVGSETCSIGRWILESRGGWVVAPGEVSVLTEILVNAASRKSQGGKEESARLRRYSAERFDRSINARRVAEACCRAQSYSS